MTRVVANRAARDGARRRSRRRTIGVDDVVLQGGAHDGRQEGVVVDTRREGRRAQQRLNGVRRVGVRYIDVEEAGLGADVAFFIHILGFDIGGDVVGQLEVGADLEARGFRLRRPREAAEGGVGVVAVAADVERTVGADRADTRAHVDEARLAVFVPEGLGRIDGEAGGHGEAGAVGQRDQRVRSRRGLLAVGHVGDAPARTTDVAHVVEQTVVVVAVSSRADRRVGRIRVHGDDRATIAQPGQVFTLDVVDLFVFREGVEVQAIVKEVLTDQARDAARQRRVEVVTRDLTHVGVDLEAFEVLAQVVVQHAGNGVSAVNRRSAAGDDLDVLDQQARNGVDVDQQAADLSADLTATVDQRQHAVRAQRAQVGGRNAGDVQRTGGVRRNQGVRQGRNGRQIVDDAGHASVHQLLLAHLDQRRRGVDRVTTDTRTRNDDLADLGRLFVHLNRGDHNRTFFRLLGEGRSRNGDQAGQDGRPE